MADLLNLGRGLFNESRNVSFSLCGLVELLVHEVAPFAPRLFGVFCSRRIAGEPCQRTEKWNDYLTDNRYVMFIIYYAAELCTSLHFFCAVGRGI
jgi:hypothetical protein